MVEERFAKMEEYGDDWEDTKPVCQTTSPANSFNTRPVHKTIC